MARWRGCCPMRAAACSDSVAQPHGCEFAADKATRRAALDSVREVRREFDGPDAMGTDEARAPFARW